MKTLAILVAFTTACAPDLNIDEDGAAEALPVELEEMIAKTAGDLPEDEPDTVEREREREREPGITSEMANLIIKRIALDVIGMGCDITTTFIGQYSADFESFELVGRRHAHGRVYEAIGNIVMKDSKTGEMDGDVHIFSPDTDRPKKASAGDIHTVIHDGRLSGEMNIKGALTRDVFGVSITSPKTDRGYLLGVTAFCD
jgi:hypothetical protein